MKKRKTILTICIGIISVLLMIISSLYSINFNESRLVAPMNFAEYTFRVKDLPMICSITFFCIYVLYIFSLLVRKIIADNYKAKTSQTTGFTRNINPKLGLLGFLGFLGFSGFWTYNIDHTTFPFAFFMFFGFFAFFYEGKMSNTLMDERYKENEMRAQLTALKIAFSIIFISIIVCGHGHLMGNPEYTLIAIMIIWALACGLAIFLSEYLLYRYDNSTALH